jgi:hypothetical protein
MTTIGIDVNGVLRNTILKFEQVYEKYLVDTDEDDAITYEITFSGDSENLSGITENVNEESFKYEVLSTVNSDNLLNHFAFPSSDDLYSFMYEEYPMELFGHAPSTEMTTFNTLNDLYIDIRDDYDLMIVSNEIGKSKPATLFFLSKFGCLIERVFFYSEIKKNDMWDSVDILLTANPDLLLNKPIDKIVVKYNTIYNKHIHSEYEIDKLSDFNDVVKKIKNDVYNF